MTCNGDSEGWANWERIRDETHADSVMIARAAERNPSVFLPTGPKSNVHEVIPKLLNIAQYTNNPWGNTKFLLNQFKPSAPPISTMSKAERKEAQETITRSKSVEDLAKKLDIELNRGLAILAEIEQELKAREGAEASSDVFQERKEAVQEGVAVDEPVEAGQESEFSAPEETLQVKL